MAPVPVLVCATLVDYIEKVNAWAASSRREPPGSGIRFEADSVVARGVYFAAIASSVGETGSEAEFLVPVEPARGKRGRRIGYLKVAAGDAERGIPPRACTALRRRGICRFDFTGNPD
jgi:hypothetical protein